MTQLIIDGIFLPETSRDKYQCYPGELSVNVEMISGRMVREVRGHVQYIVWSYDYMGNELWRQLSQVLRSNASFTVAYLPDDGDELVSGEFLVESITQPTFAFSRGGVGLWHNVGFTLREVRPHD
ncbi:hypothetical protein [Alistipes sp.]|uniref:hypothetical protein n=1 Tax=Alistipes sp. TaxID=1872444 RepID=UPI003993E074